MQGESTMVIAICQLNIQYEDKASNIARAKELIEKAASQKADIILFPEMSVTGFSMETGKFTELQDKSTTVDTFCDMASKYNIRIGLGVALCDENGKAGNHYLMIDKDGTVLADYTKIHPFSISGEDQFFDKGNEIVHYEIGGFSCSHFICYDLRFPEVFHVASKKAELIFVPANWPKARIEQYRALLCARAIENQAYVIGINCTGQQGSVAYDGGSAAYDYLGREVIKLNDEQLTYVTIDNAGALREYRQNFPVKRDIRWGLYKNMYEKEMPEKELLEKEPAE